MPPTIAILNSNDDVVEMLRTLLEGAGFNTVSTHVPQIKRGDEDFIAFIRTHEPAVVVYDIAPPYRENWNFLKLVLDTETAKKRRFVVTTANLRLLREAAGEAIQVIEIAEKPDNLEQILQAVKQAVSS
jgi:CheY-like chemotaxis protein